MLRYDFYRSWYLQSNTSIARVDLRSLDLNFHIQTFQMAILTRTFSDNTNITTIGSHVFAIEWCLRECYRSWHTFSRSRIMKCEYLETMKASEIWSGMTFIDVDIFVIELPMLFYVTFKFISRSCHAFAIKLSRLWMSRQIYLDSRGVALV